MLRLRLALLAVLVVAACGDQAASDTAEGAGPAEEVASPEIFEGLPVLPGSRLMGGSADAAEAVVDVPVTVDSVARWYRRVLLERSWAIRGDATAADRSVTLHATSPEGRPIWIMMRPLADGTTARVSVIATRP
jgi:hypothetical protein